MKEKKFKKETIYKIVIIGLLTALSAALGFIKIPLLGVSITLVLPVIVIGGALYGPWVGAWLTVIPNIVAIPDAGLFLTEAPAGCIATMILKGLLAGFLASIIYKAMAKKRPLGAVTCAAVVAPVVNTAVFLSGCFIFIWHDLVAKAGEAGIGMGLLIVGMVGINFVIELILNLILCPSILRIIQLTSKGKKI